MFSSLKTSILVALTLFLFSTISFAGNTPNLNQWVLINTFDQGKLFKHLTIPQVTLSLYHNDNHQFFYNRQLKVEEYLKGLEFSRQKSFAIGGLKNWKYSKLIDKKLIKNALILTFVGTYQRENGTVLTLYERHFFYHEHFWQWQIIYDEKTTKVDESIILNTFEELTHEVSP